MAYLKIEEKEFGFFDVNDLKEKGLELAEKYDSAKPFPHTVIDDFLPKEVLDRCLEDFPQDVDPDGASFDRPQERLKSSFNPDFLSPQLRSLFYSFGSRPFLNFLENLTGIEGLIPDPYFTGGGFHKIGQGGHLSVHADFNFHKKLNLERRINILIYLNKDWSPEYGGQIELWDDDLKNCVVSKTPQFNRCVIFNTTSKSMHGNPQSVNHPDNLPRRSIALYYYTATWDGTRRKHTTQFRTRPNSTDEIDWKVRRRELVNDLLPPILVRIIRRGMREIGF